MAVQETAATLRGLPVPAVRSILVRYWPLMRGLRARLAAAVLLLVLAAACDTVGVWMFMEIVDRSLAAGDLATFWTPAAIWAGLAVLGGTASFAGGYLAEAVTERFLLRLRDSVFGHLQRLSPDFFESNRIGDLVSRLSGDVAAVEAIVSSGLVDLASSAAMLGCFLAALLYLRWDLALVVLVVVPLLWLCTRLFARRMTDVSRDERSGEGRITAIAEESLSNAMLVQAYNAQAVQSQRMHRHGRIWMRAKLAEARLAAGYAPLVTLLETAGTLIVLAVGAWEISQGRMTLGALVAFAAYLGYLYPPLHDLGELTVTVASAKAGAERLNEILDTPPRVADRTGALDAPATAGVLELLDVGFRYPGADRDSLTGLWCTAYPGELVLITGSSGAGKSTVAKLLLRFYDPDRGTIRVQGTDLRRLSLAAVRDSITLLHQETMLFDTTVAENIGYGSTGASPDRIVDAARAAGAHAFVTALPDGYDTRVGQRGRKLSGGQRQRIAIARAILRDSPILVLDEPTAGLDATTAQQIGEALLPLMRSRTTIMISHDLRLAPTADVILVLEQGRCVERGNHRTLLADNGRYARLYRTGAAQPPTRTAV